MNTRQIKYVLALAEYKRFAAVAKKYFVSQSSVSKQIHALEEELEVKLFRRTRHGVEMTPEGVELIDALKKCKEIFIHALENVLLQDTKDNNLILGFVESFDAHPELPKAISELRSRHVDSDITVNSYTYKGIMDVVTERKADVFFCPEECINDNVFETLFLWETSQALMVPVDHELAITGDLESYNFSNERFMMISIGPNDRRETIDNLKKAFNISEGQINFYENMSNFSANIESLKGLSITPKLDVYINNPNFIYLPVDSQLWQPCKVIAAWRKDNMKPTLIELVSILKQYFPQDRQT